MKKVQRFATPLVSIYSFIEASVPVLASQNHPLATDSSLHPSVSSTITLIKSLTYPRRSVTIFELL